MCYMTAVFVLQSVNIAS